MEMTELLKAMMPIKSCASRLNLKSVTPDYFLPPALTSDFNPDPLFEPLAMFDVGQTRL